MAEIKISNAVKKFGDFTALKEISLDIHDREFMVLLGPSGCGKTTLLRAVAGLGMADSGHITIDGKDVTYLPPSQRGISMVFQSYAIFPHMKVYDNIAFGLRMKKTDANETDKRVRQAAELLHIESLLDRYPSNMSGGQRQRVAVARAIAYGADVILMDEPLSNLDALLRLEMRAELKRLLFELNATTIYVTHDQIEAMSMGDRIAVMKDGIIQQVDTPTMIYDNPSNEFVGGFMGNPPMNFLTGQVVVDGGNVKVKVGDNVVTPAESLKDELKQRDGKNIVIGIRAENMETLHEAGEDTLPVNVSVVEPLGAQNLLTVQMGDSLIKVSTHPDFATQPDSTVHLRFPVDKIRWMDYDTRKGIYPK